MEELLRDGAFPYQVGRLTGAATMVAYWLSLRDDEECKKMGEKLNEVVSWFFFQEGGTRKNA
jgi:hypothetical protein